ncbi:MAG TPA: magnesium transporter CorA, partial [Eubacterium sp.]|nr:magnesium transporter CorA [Eubacterium sp.]
MSKYYNIKELLDDCEKRDLVKGTPYVAILSYEEWCNDMESYDFGIDLDLSIIDIHNTKAEVNYDS